MDIRLPVGLLFIIIGVLLTSYGLLVEVTRFAGYNLDLIWGPVMGVFGILMLLLARRSTP